MLSSILTTVTIASTFLSPVNSSNPQFQRSDDGIQCGWTMSLALPDTAPGEVNFYGVTKDQACVADEAHFVGTSLLGVHISGTVSYEGSRGFVAQWSGDGVSGYSRDNESFAAAWSTIPNSILRARAIEISAWRERLPYPEW